MNPQTRQLVALLADDLSGRLIGALRREPRSVPQLVRDTGASQKTLAHVLELLQAHGIAEHQQAEPGAPGRPSRVWRLVADHELGAFERACDDFKARMLRHQLVSYNDPDGG
jgi:predicted ArsR family transcriptional regulator